MNALFVVWRLLSNSNEIELPVAKAWEKLTLNTPVLVCRVGTPFRVTLVSGNV